MLERFERIEHLHTVGTSPQMADAAALLLIGTREQADAVGLRPRARIVSSTTATCDPVIMLTAGQEAMEQAIERAGLAPRDIDVFEFAEAFAALCLRFRRDLDAGPGTHEPQRRHDRDGSRLRSDGRDHGGGCLDELERREGRFGVAGVSGAAGLGVGLVLERCSD